MCNRVAVNGDVLISDVIRLGLAHAAEIDSVAVKSQIR